ncbi:hypothetical protein [Ohtaekwangia koreensis]|uniref:Sugar or nucleoside kinase, ribokinase family n=1 Tax=Ohtaekwangia koreensis TaxID=688867 RepID=A0A1T5M5V6_9BACT|nr:hypothetical protein [Ohtaekwangia koreensis]SKC83513.1 Sugar or nucleoside kinase, ribokinase family [Ohtaekwangia koreensis]
MDTTISALSELQELLRSSQHNSAASKKVFVGFDGFVDKIKRAVMEKQNTRTLYFDSIRDFANRILLACGKSGQIQMDTQRVKFGGNAPILADTLGRLGIQTYCLGSMGYPQLHQVFSGMNPRSETISVLNPGQSDAIEFSDGKLIFSELEVFDQYTWEYIIKIAGIEAIHKAISDSTLIAFVDWANLPHASNIWEGMLEDIIKPSKRKDYLFFFDLCDPSKKTTEQIDEVLDLVSSFSCYGKVTLGLNENETLKIYAALRGIDYITDSPGLPPVKQAGDSLYKSMNIDALLVHPVDRCILFHQHEANELNGRLVLKPKVLTGGGDNLNAGYCLGMLLGFSSAQCMLLGMAVSGAYVENGFSADLQGILQYLDIWMAELLQKNELSRQHVFAHRHE